MKKEELLVLQDDLYNQYAKINTSISKLKRDKKLVEAQLIKVARKLNKYEK